MRVRVQEQALLDLEQIRAWIAQENPAASRNVVSRIRSAIAGLADHPKLGKPGRQRDTRDLIVARLPYVVVYRLGRNEVLVVGIFHTARVKRRRV